MQLVGLVHHLRELRLDPLQVDLELVLLGGEALLAGGPLLSLAPGLAGQVGVEGFDLLIVLLHALQLRARILQLLAEACALFVVGGLPRLPVLLQCLDLGEQRGPLLAKPLELGLDLAQLGGLLARLVQIGLQ